MSTARDAYREYFTEKLWSWLPAIHRELDETIGQNVHHAMLAALAEQAALIKRSHDRLWDDQYIELADDWAVPYIAKLVATRLVSALNPRARRVDVAKTIYYRRRKGTLAVLEQLIADMTAWDGKVVEEFRRLNRMRHGLDGTAKNGRLSQTPEGGLADLRHARAAQLVGDPFDEFHYTPDMRRPNGQNQGANQNSKGIHKLSLHVYTATSVEFNGVQPRRLRNLVGPLDAYTFDPSGRDIALYAANDPARDWSQWRTADEWALPRPITCRLLGETHYRITDTSIAWILNGAPIANLGLRQAAALDLKKLQGQTFLNAAALLRVLAGLPSQATLMALGVQAGLLERSLIDHCGSAALLPGDNGQAAFGAPVLQVGILAGPATPRTRTRACQLSNWVVPAMPNIDWFVDPTRGRFLFNSQGEPAHNIRVRYRTGIIGSVGAGAPQRQTTAPIAPVVWQAASTAPGIPANGTTLIMDSATYRNPPDMPMLINTTVTAQEGERPYIRLQNHWRFTANGNNRTLLLDGLWIGGRPYGDIWLDGNFERVVLRHCTLDPGGFDALGNWLSPCELVVRGFVEELVIEHSILPNIRLNNAQASIERLIIQDSIVHTRTPNVTALALPRTHVDMKRTTVIAQSLNTLAIDVERLNASDSLIAGRIDVTDTQQGCFRFSARAANSRVPHPYESHVIVDDAGLFISRRFGDVAFAKPSILAPKSIVQGSEMGSEMGAYCDQIKPIKTRSLTTKVDEYVPFGRLPNLILDY